MSIELLANIVGMCGTSLVVGAYFLLQLDRLDAKGLAYNVMNLVGALLLLFSLFVHFNLASVVIELFWIGASLLGVFQVVKRRRAKTGD